MQKEGEREGKAREGKGRKKERKTERKRTAARQSLSGRILLVLALFLVCSWSLVVLGGLMVGGGWKSIALNNEPQGSTLTPLSTVWSSLSCILSFQTERESNCLSISYFPSFSLSISLPFPSISFASLRHPGPTRSLLLLNTRKEVFVSSPSPQLCYETPSNPIRITDGRGGEAGGHGK